MGGLIIGDIVAIILCLRMAIACRNERNKIRRIDLQNEKKSSKSMMPIDY